VLLLFFFFFFTLVTGPRRPLSLKLSDTKVYEPQIRAQCAGEREFFIDNLLARIHCIIVMTRWTGLAPWEFEFPFPGRLTSTFLKLGRAGESKWRLTMYSAGWELSSLASALPLTSHMTLVGTKVVADIYAPNAK